MRLDLETLSRTSSNESDNRADFRLEVSNDLAQHQAVLVQTVDRGIKKVDKVDERITRIEELLMAQAVGIDESQYPESKANNQPTAAAMRRQPRRVASTPDAQKSAAKSQAIGIRVKKNIGPVCRPACSCRCHLERRSQSYGYFDHIIGRLFVGYSGLPLVNTPCDSTRCQRSQTSYISAEYWFPLGFFWSQIVRLELGYQPQIGPQWELTTLRRVPDSAQCVRFALEGDIIGLKGLFQHGLASPRDVSSTRGYSLLRWALYGQQYETCRFLLAAGSDPDYKPISANDDCPADKACDILLRGGLSTGITEVLRCISRDSEFIENQDFAPIHKIVLKLSLLDLEAEILRDPDNIDVRDAMGRTALEWAAARGDDRAVITLLSLGAEPNIMDNKLNTPLTLASNQGHTLCVRLLLEAGALANPITPPGVKFGSPLNCAARNATDPLLMKTLLDFNADIEASGVDGITPLLHVARGKPVSFAKLLLDYGADINATSKDGLTSLTAAIIYNNHDVLHLLLDRWFEYTECPRLKSPHLLDLIIDYADIETMSILTSATHLQIHGDNSYVLEKSAAQLRKRLDLTDDMVVAFEGLLDTIREYPKHSKSREKHAESGLLDLGQDQQSSGEETDEYEDAQESLSLVSDDLTTLVRHRPRPTMVVSATDEQSKG